MELSPAQAQQVVEAVIELRGADVLAMSGHPLAEPDAAMTHLFDLLRAFGVSEDVAAQAFLKRETEPERCKQALDFMQIYDLSLIRGIDIWYCGRFGSVFSLSDFEGLRGGWYVSDPDPLEAVFRAADSAHLDADST